MTPRLGLLLLLLLLPGVSAAAKASTDGAGVLRLAGERVVLAGIEAPPRAALCGEQPEQWRCGRIADLAFEQRLQQTELRCAERPAEGAARCSAGGEDLALWLIDAGWARALGDAPAEYRAAERGARDARRGIWRDQTGRWRLSDDPDPGCDVCAARHARVTDKAD